MACTVVPPRDVEVPPTEEMLDSISRDIDALKLILGPTLAADFIENYFQWTVAFSAYLWEAVIPFVNLVKDRAIGLARCVDEVAELPFCNTIFGFACDDGYYQASGAAPVSTVYIEKSTDHRRRELRAMDAWKHTVFVNVKHLATGPAVEFDRGGTSITVELGDAVLVAWIWKKWLKEGDSHQSWIWLSMLSRIRFQQILKRLHS